MLEIELSTIPDADVDTRVMKSLLAEFTQRTGIQVRLNIMTWGTAWNDFVTFASHGRGPDLSHIGGTWVSSLAIMNALRPFNAKEVQDMGGAKAFLSPTWQSGMLHGDGRTWAIPWTGYTFVVCYRKDLLGQLGINGESAFGTIDALSQTVQKLERSQLDIPWLIPTAPPPYSELVHMAASWIWESGGDYIRVDETGEEVIFDKPEALRGLKAWLTLYRSMPEAYGSLNHADTSNLFAQGRAAAVIADNRFAASIQQSGAEEVVKNNLGVAPLTSVPWYGGGSFIIWRHTQGYPERASAAVKLINFLTGKAAETRWGREVRSLPARVEALQGLYPPADPLHDAFIRASELGRAYLGLPLWRRLEYQIAQGLSVCIREARENRSTDVETILHNQLAPLAERLNLTIRE